ncbi:MAG: UvrB/UvrC motif-containing protein [Gemmatimonadales bacterium]|jgi:protein arginine kinase activator
MLCDNCGEREAAIHLTQIVNNSVTTLHLCEQCAAEKGVETGASVAKFPLGDFLASLGKTAGGEQAEVASGAACPFCGGTLKDFRETGRLGCAMCYTTFEPHLRDLLRRLHGSSQHAGERYTGTAAAPAAEAPADVGAPEVGELREQLKRAVEAENFELAAELRDRLKVLE